MARPSGILERFWLQNYPQNGNKKWSNSDFGELWFFLPLPCEINVFTVQDPSKNNTKSLQKKTLQPYPPKSLIFNLRAHLDGNMSRQGFQKGSFWGGREHQKQPWGWKLRILGGSGCRVFCWRDFTPQNGPMFSPNGCQNGFPKLFKLTKILSKEVSRTVLNETNSGK